MEKEGYIIRQRSETDERKVILRLTETGVALKEQAASIPQKLAASLLAGPLSTTEVAELKRQLCQLIKYLSEEEGK
ncbi:MAG: hypothetical protein LUD02_04870 [Tannerellaceae bacterium]|nr:hypothetical protein [Tannerellaceae bacterium]MCD8263561.1 hypothetical protein [Tannerellaceae bacterium]